jgi:6-phosphofructokinase 1
LLGGVAAGLATLVSAKLNVRTRSEKPGVLCRAFSGCRSSVDAREAYEIGRYAVVSAMSGESQVMVGMRRVSTRNYQVSLILVPLTRVCERERVLPRRYIRPPADVQEEYRNYVAPLIGRELVPPEYLFGL